MISPVAGAINRARLGFPEYYFRGTGGIGDDLLCSTVFRELKQRGSCRIVFTTPRSELFEYNRDANKIFSYQRTRLDYWLRKGLPFIRLAYTEYDPLRDADKAPDEHILVKMCRLAGIVGRVELRPYLYLTPKELSAGKIGARQVVIQSSGLSSANVMRNKEWYPQRFQEICAKLCPDFTIVQLGSTKDPKLEGAIDLRGQTNFRQSAAIMANSLVFVGLVGFMMHLARSVDCRAVIIYGGREKPEQTGYVANKNLYSPVPCAPCWLRNPCDFDHKCMNMITTQQVITATLEQIACVGSPLEVEIADI